MPPARNRTHRRAVAFAVLLVVAVVAVPSWSASDPGVSAQPGRDADENGWYNHAVTINFEGPEGYNCPPVTYGNDPGEPDSASAQVETTCTAEGLPDLHGDYTFKYDATAPTVSLEAGRSPDENGWYNHAVTLSAEATNNGPSGPGICGSVLYSGPDDGAASVTRSCTDGAGNGVGDTKTLKYDATEPTVSVQAGRSPDENGWYNHAVTLSGEATNNGPSGPGSCGSTPYSGPDDGAASVTRSCTDGAGNRNTGGKTFRYDSTPPSVTVSADRQPDHEDWYTEPVTFSAGATDNGPSDGAGCQTDLAYSGPGTDAGKVTRTCADGAGNEGSDTRTFKYDAKAPWISLPGKPAKLSRNPAPRFRFSAVERVAKPVQLKCALDEQRFRRCSSPLTFSGLDDGRHTLHVRATDSAGNERLRDYGWRIDTVPPPAVVGLRAVVRDRIGYLTISLFWQNQASRDRDHVVVKRGNRSRTIAATRTSLTEERLPTRTHRYAVKTVDKAGNAATRWIRVRPLLLTPSDGAVLSRAPRLFDWQSLANSSGYHFQLWRLTQDGKLKRMVFRSWPDASAARFNRRLADGRYGWWVWRRVGPNRFQLIGRSAFTKH